MAQSCLTLCHSMDCSLPGSSVHGIFQARLLEWVAISFFRGPSRPGDQTHITYISFLGRRLLYLTTREIGKMDFFFLSLPCEHTCAGVCLYVYACISTDVNQAEVSALQVTMGGLERSLWTQAHKSVRTQDNGWQTSDNQDIN